MKEAEKKQSAAESEAGAWKAKKDAADSQCTAVNHDLNEQILAYAKQAKVCDNIKKQLHFK